MNSRSVCSNANLNFQSYPCPAQSRRTGRTWTEKDEIEFKHMLEVELDKVYSFQKTKVILLTALPWSFQSSFTTPLLFLGLLMAASWIRYRFMAAVICPMTLTECSSLTLCVVRKALFLHLTTIQSCIALYGSRAILQYTFWTEFL